MWNFVVHFLNVREFLAIFPRDEMLIWDSPARWSFRANVGWQVATVELEIIERFLGAILIYKTGLSQSEKAKRRQVIVMT